MPECRLYFLDEAGQFIRSHEIEAADDADALTRAKEMKLLAASELWDHKRIVARIPARG
jgi:hypothetical protein